MFWLNLAYAVLLPLAAGFFTVNLFLNKREDAGLIERIAYGYCLGTLIMTLWMAYVLSKLNIPYSVISVSLPLIVLVLIGLIYTIKNQIIDLSRPILAPLKNLKPIEIILIALIMIQVVFVLSSSMIKPVVGVDAWANYSLRAKAYYLDKTDIPTNLSDTDRGKHNSLLQTWTFLCLNEWNDQWGKLLLPLYFPVLLAIFFFAVRRKRDRLIALLGTAILATLPFLVYHATLEYCDFLMATYLFTTFVLLLHWDENKNITTFSLLLLFLATLPSMKNEGYMHLILMSIFFIILLYRKAETSNAHVRALKTTFPFVGILGGIFFIYRGIFAHSVVLNPAIWLERLFPTLSVFMEYLFIRNNWSFIFAPLLIAIIFNLKKIKNNLYSTIPLLFSLSEILFFILFYISMSDEVYNYLFYVTPAVRNMLQFMPIVVLSLALGLSFDAVKPSLSTKKRSIR